MNINVAIKSTFGLLNQIIVVKKRTISAYLMCVYVARLLQG